MLPGGRRLNVFLHLRRFEWPKVASKEERPARYRRRDHRVYPLLDTSPPCQKLSFFSHSSFFS